MFFHIEIQGQIGIQALILCFSLSFKARTLARACGPGGGGGGGGGGGHQVQVCVTYFVEVGVFFETSATIYTNMLW